MVPFQLALGAVPVFERHTFLELKQLVHEAKMGLDDNIEASCSYIATTIVSCYINHHYYKVTHYARGRESLSARITSAMQIVAERETPTRQWTRIGSFARRPSSVIKTLTLALLVAEDRLI